MLHWPVQESCDCCTNLHRSRVSAVLALQESYECCTGPYRRHVTAVLAVQESCEYCTGLTGAMSVLH